MYGLEWLDETFKLIQQDKRDYFLMVSQLLPIARTPMDKESGRSSNKYMKDIRKALYGLTPWDAAGGAIRAAYQDKVKSGSVMVVLDEPTQNTIPIFKDAQVIK